MRGAGTAAAALAVAVALTAAGALAMAAATAVTDRRPAGSLRLGPALAPGDGAAAWEIFRLGRRPVTAYDAVATGGVRARARRSAALLFLRVAAEAEATPVLQWRWRVERLPAGADLTRRERDDAAARVYVGFRYTRELVPPGQRLAYRLFAWRHGEYPPLSGLAYVWSGRPAAGTAMRHPDYERLHEIVLRDAGDPTGTWIAERRDVLADYRAAFAADPPPISHVAVMCDADDTGSAAEAWFDTLELLPGGGAAGPASAPMPAAAAAGAGATPPAPGGA